MSSITRLPLGRATTLSEKENGAFGKPHKASHCIKDAE